MGDWTVVSPGHDQMPDTFQEEGGNFFTCDGQSTYADACTVVPWNVSETKRMRETSVYKLVFVTSLTASRAPDGIDVITDGAI